MQYALNTEDYSFKDKMAVYEKTLDKETFHNIRVIVLQNDYAYHSGIPSYKDLADFANEYRIPREELLDFLEEELGSTGRLEGYITNFVLTPDDISDILTYNFEEICRGMLSRLVDKYEPVEA